MPFSHRFALSGLLVGLAGAAAWAQECWLLPPQFFVAPDTRQSMRVLTGSDFAGKPWSGRSSRLASFVHYAPNDTTDHTRQARQADTLNLSVEFIQPGVHVLAFSTTEALAELKAADFNAYLRQQGLDGILAARQQRQELGRAGREAYRRCAKTLVQVGATSFDTARTYAVVAGQPLELVPEQNPYTLKTGASLTVRVLAAGQPVRGALVRVWQRGAGPPAPAFTLRSNQNGRVLFRLSGGGSYLVSTVRMMPAADAKLADWQSTWATLTFAGPGISGR